MTQRKASSHLRIRWPGDRHRSPRVIDASWHRAASAPAPNRGDDFAGSEAGDGGERHLHALLLQMPYAGRVARHAPYAVKQRRLAGGEAMSSRTSFITALIASAGLTLAAQTPADFSGTWKLDPNLSTAVGGGTGAGTGGGNSMGGGLGLGASPGELTITQTATTLTIEQHGSVVSRVVYRLDGRESRGSMPAGQRTRSATFKSAWKDGKLVTTIVTEGPGGRGLITYEETRYLTPEGTLVVETRDPSRGNMRRVVYRRA
jgi:hypothetical protein